MAAVAVLRNETLQAFLQVCAQLCSLWLLRSLGNSLVPFVCRVFYRWSYRFALL